MLLVEVLYDWNHGNWSSAGGTIWPNNPPALIIEDARARSGSISLQVREGNDTYSKIVGVTDDAFLDRAVDTFLSMKGQPISAVDVAELVE